MRRVLFFAALMEVATGLILLAAPSVAGQLLLGEALTGAAVAIARVTGISLIALGITCWPGPPLLGMTAYGAAVAAYLAYLAFAGIATGMLLWPAVLLHVVLTALLARNLPRTLREWRHPPAG